MIFSEEIERQVIAAILFSVDARIITFEKLTRETFYEPLHQRIFELCKRQFHQSGDVDLSIIEDELKNDIEDPFTFIAEVNREFKGGGNIGLQCEVLKDKFKKRRLEQICQTTASSVLEDDGAGAIELLEETSSQIFELLNDDVRNHVHGNDEIITDALQHILKIQENEDGVTGQPSGLDLDRLTSGFQDSTLSVLAARPSMGKTALALQIMQNMAGNAAILSLETSYKSIGQRMIISESGIDGQKLRRGMLTNEQITQVQDAAYNLLERGIIVDDSTNVTPDSLRIKGKSLAAKFDIKFLVVDFIQLMNSDEERRDLQVAACSRTCKLLCKELDIPVLILSQLSRKCENRTGIHKRPQLSDLRDSGAIEQDADLVVSMFRPEYYGIDNYPQGEGKWAGKPTGGVCELIVSKQKDGPTGIIRQKFDRQTMTFQNFTHHP